jgi:hypothetical protein
MRIFITCDCYWETKVDKVIDKIDATGYKRYFADQNYGSTLENITIILMCQNPELKLKQRIKFAKNDKKLYVDIMLDFLLMLDLSQIEREKNIADKIISEIPIVIAKYKFADFNLSKFELDLRNWIGKIR